MVESLCMRCKDLCTWSYVCCVAGQPAVAGQTSRCPCIRLSKYSYKYREGHGPRHQVGRSDASRDETPLHGATSGRSGVARSISSYNVPIPTPSTDRLKGAKHSPRSSRHACRGLFWAAFRFTSRYLYEHAAPKCGYRTILTGNVLEEVRVCQT